jgi:hypothetical protein
MFLEELRYVVVRADGSRKRVSATAGGSRGCFVDHLARQDWLIMICLERRGRKARGVGEAHVASLVASRVFFAICGIGRSRVLEVKMVGYVVAKRNMWRNANFNFACHQRLPLNSNSGVWIGLRCLVLLF